MDIILKREFGCREYTLDDAIRCTLDGSSYDRGTFETIQAHIEKQNDFLVRLTNILVEKNILEDEDIVDLLNDDFRIVLKTK